MRNVSWKSTLSLFAVLVLVAFSYGCEGRDDDHDDDAMADNTAMDTTPEGGTTDTTGGMTTAPGDPNRSVGTMVDDQTIQTKVKAQLLADERVSGLSIDTQVINGTVTLMGTVRSEDQKTAAEEIAKSVEGVTSVQNQLTVSAQ